MPDSNPLGQQPPAQNGGGIDKQALIRLAALIPLAMSKGGQPAVAGLLNGFQQGMARQRQMGMEQSQQDWQQQYQQAQLTRQDAAEGRLQENADRQAEQQRLEQRRKFLELATGNPEADEAEAMQRLEMLTRQAPSFGVSQLDVEQAAYVAPTRREKARIERALANIDKMYPPSEERERLALSDVMGPNGRPLTVGEARQRVSGATGAAPVVRPTANAVNAGSFEDYVIRYAKDKGVTVEQLTSAQIEDARKRYQQSDDRPRVNVNLPGGVDPKQVAVFNRIAGEYERSPLVRAADRTVVLKDAIAAVRQNPNDPTNQLNLAYGYIQALDTYQSAVREGELANLSRLGSIFQNLQAKVQRITEGNIVPPDVARSIADNAARMVTAIEQGRDQKKRDFESRARVSGVGELWTQFQAGSVPPKTEAPPQGPPVGTRRTINGVPAEWDGKGWKRIQPGK
jgi:hypothetical protein